MNKMNVLIDKEGSSGTYDLCSLKNDDNIYVMDNHMAAGWCWSQKIDFDKSYSLLHIDKHYDLLEGGLERNLKAINDLEFDLKKSKIEEYCFLKYPKKYEEQENQIFRFDNYMTILKGMYPDLFDKKVFATHKDGSVPSDWNFYEPGIIELCADNIEYWINDSKSSWIINIDVDYFFTKNTQDEYFQFLGDQYIIQIAKQLTAIRHKVEVMTIALSPNFCGGIENSIRVANLILREFDLKY